MSNDARRGKRLFAGFIAGAMALSVAPLVGFAGPAGALEPATGDGSVCEDPPNPEPFTDVTEADPSQAEIECLVNTGITEGTTATTYSPNSQVTRRQMAKFLTRFADAAEANEVGDEITELPQGDGETDFTDIADEDDETQDAIDRLADAGIALGVTATEFEPNANVTRRQMAKFIVRLQEFLAGEDATPDNPDDAFTDDDGDSGEEELNILAEEGVFIGDGEGNVNPGADISRRQMANVLVRKLQYHFELGDITRLFAEDDGDAGTVTSNGANPVLFDTDDGESISADLTADDDTTDTFFVDGAAATEAAFIAATSPGDRIVLSDSDGDGNYDVHNLTNNPVPQSGMVGAVGVDTDDFSIITAAGTVLDTHNYGDTNDTYTVDGASVSLAAFELALSLGDTVVTTDTVPATPDGDPETYALTNGNWDGTVAVTGGVGGTNVTFEADGVGDDPLLGAADAEFNVTAAGVTGGTQVVTIDGAAATYAQFETAITDGDTVVYSRAGGVERFALTNVTFSTSFSGTTDENTDSGTNTIGYISGSDQDTFDYSLVTNYRVNGVVATQGEFEIALDGAGSLPWGEAVSFDQATGVLSITTATSFGPNPIAAVTTTDDDGGDLSNDTFNIVSADGDVYVTGLAADTAVDGKAPRYFVNGTEVSAAMYEDYLVDIDADVTGDATFGGDSFQVVVAALATEHRLTTNNTL